MFKTVGGKQYQKFPCRCRVCMTLVSFCRSPAETRTFEAYPFCLFQTKQTKQERTPGVVVVVVFSDFEPISFAA